MHGDDGFGFRGDLAADIVDPEIETGWAGIDENRRRADASDAAGRCKKSERRTDDFGAGTDPQRHQREKDCVRSRGDADSVPDTDHGRDLLFKTLDLGAEDELAGTKHRLEAGLALVFRSNDLTIQ